MVALILNSRSSVAENLYKSVERTEESLKNHYSRTAWVAYRFAILYSRYAYISLLHDHFRAYICVVPTCTRSFSWPNKYNVVSACTRGKRRENLNSKIWLCTFIVQGVFDDDVNSYMYRYEYLYEIHSSCLFIVNWFHSDLINAGVENLHFELTSFNVCWGFVKTTNGSCEWNKIRWDEYLWRVEIILCSNTHRKTKLDFQVCLCTDDYDEFGMETHFWNVD